MRISRFNALLFFLLSLVAHGDTLDDWLIRIRNQPIARIAADLTAGRVSWPSFSVQSGDPRQRKTERQFANSFISACDRSYDEFLATPDEKVLDVYRGLILAIRKDGGYLNAILLDTVYRMALTRIASSMLSAPGKTKEIRVLLDSLQQGPWRSVSIGEILAAKSGNRRFATEYQTWPEPEILTRISKISSLSAADGKSVEDLARQPSSVLIQKNETIGLIYRLAETQMLYEYTLPGVLRFLDLGGKLNNLSDADVSEFTRLMSRERKAFKFPLFGIQMLRSVDLLTVKKEFANIRPAFLQVALT